MQQDFFREVFHKLSDKQRKQAYIVICLCFLAGLGLTYYIQQASLKSSPSSILQFGKDRKISPARLTLSSNSQKVKQNDTVIVTLTLDSGNQEVDAGDFYISFDPEKLSVSNVTNGTYFTSWPKNVVENGVIKISGTASLEENRLIIPIGKGTVATISFTAIGIGDAKIFLDKKETIVASNGKNILDTNTLTELNVKVE